MVDRTLAQSAGRRPRVRIRVSTPTAWKFAILPRHSRIEARVITKNLAPPVLAADLKRRARAGMVPYDGLLSSQPMTTRFRAAIFAISATVWGRCLRMAFLAFDSLRGPTGERVLRQRRTRRGSHSRPGLWSSALVIGRRI